MRPLKSFLATLAAVLSIAAATAGSAAAAAPCWKTLINDWLDGRIDNVYKVACYQKAIEKVQTDAQIYSTAEDDFRRAMLSAFRHRDPGGPTGSASGYVPSGQKKTGSKGVIAQVLDWLGPNNAESIPLPLLVLAAISLLLLAAAAARVAVRKLQARRLR